MSFASYVPDLVAVGPELILCATLLVVLLVDLWRMGRDVTAVWLLAPLVTFGLVLGLFGAGRAWMEHSFSPGGANPLRLEVFALVLAYAVVTVGDLWFRERERDWWVPGAVALIGIALASLRLWEQASVVFLPAAELQRLELSGQVLGKPGAYWGQLVTLDGFSVVMRAIVLASLAVSTWFTIFYKPMQTASAQRGVGEFLACLIGAHVGGMLVTGTTHLLFIFLALEMLSLCSYMQSGMLKGDRRSAEASLKYIVFGSLASGLMLFGFSLLYGFAGDLTLQGVTTFVSQMPKHSPGGMLVALGLIATVGGLAYKLSLVPFHFWTPDVYEGSPTPTTAFLSVGSKAASFGLLLRVLTGLTGDANWAPGLVTLLAMGAAVTMTYGNLAALRQSNLKRLLAYSSIAHAGYMLMGVVALYHFTRAGDGSITGSSFAARAYEGVLFYLIAYLLMNLGAFGVVILLANKTGSEEMEDIRGLGWKSPWACGALIVFLLSLTGIPPTAGFYAKYYLFVATIDAGFLWLAVIAVVNTVLSLFYYFRLAKALFLKTSEEAYYPDFRASYWLAGCVLLLAALTLWLGVSPSGINGVVQGAASSLR